MRSPEDYLLDWSIERDRRQPVAAEMVFDRVWRFDFSAPGFCLIDFGPDTDSHALRAWMVALNERLGEIGMRRNGKRFVYRSLGRFDQQETTKFHLDGAPSESLLMLGYEPSLVRSRLFLADYSRCAFDLGIGPQQFLNDFNPMFKKGEEELRRYVTELPQPENGHSRILLINNSSLPFTEARTNPLGVMHKAEIINPNPRERRIVNSMMLTTAEGSGKDAVSEMQQAEFVATEDISNKVYG